jgi:hypothetical protein
MMRETRKRAQNAADKRPRRGAGGCRLTLPSSSTRRRRASLSMRAACSASRSSGLIACTSAHICRGEGGGGTGKPERRQRQGREATAAALPRGLAHALGWPLRPGQPALCGQAAPTFWYSSAVMTLRSWDMAPACCPAAAAAASHGLGCRRCRCRRRRWCAYCFPRRFRHSGAFSKDDNKLIGVLEARMGGRQALQKRKQVSLSAESALPPLSGVSQTRERLE